jgi:hypothetical protein
MANQANMIRPISTSRTVRDIFQNFLRVGAY